MMERVCGMGRRRVMAAERVESEGGLRSTCGEWLVVGGGGGEGG